MSVHSSKGLEWDSCFLISVEDNKFPHDKSDLLEESCLFYVAVTRAKQNLYISEIGKDNQFIKEYFG
ncbi:ATP-dependent DNA helicase UvrD1 [compost metagenome]